VRLNEINHTSRKRGGFEMIESDIRGDSNAECEMPICHGTECETHHPDCTCDNCCQPTDSFCEDNRDQCEQTHQPSGGKKMMNKLMPILAKAVVLPAVLALSTLGGNAQTLNRSTGVDADIVRYEVFNNLDHKVIENAGVDIKSIEALDENVAVNFDLQLTALDQERGVLVLDVAADQILDGVEIQSVDLLDIVEQINR
jgi:hypothetical protein